MKRAMTLLLVFTLTSCSSPPPKDESIQSFASCSSIKTRGMSADGTFLQCLEGKGELALESIEGPALISAWASWCSNCESQRPYLIELYKKAQGKIQVIGVDVEEKSKSEGFEHALKKGMPYPQLYDPDGRTSKVFGPGVPITQFKDANNQIVFQQIGPFKSYEELQTLVAKYLGVEIG